MGVGTEPFVFVKLHNLSLLYCMPKQSRYLANKACIQWGRSL